LSLQKIISNVQLICEAIASVVNIDVTIVDSERIRLAGTGTYRESIGERVSENSAFNYALREGIGFIIENPGEHQACLNCDCKSKCNEHAEVCCPIRLDGDTVGVIGLIAFKEEQRQALIDNQENLMAFLDRMADLISSKLKEHESHEALELLAKELEVVVDSIDTSLIATDVSGQLLRMNRKFHKTFGMQKATHLSDLFSEEETKQIQSARENSKNHYYTFANGIQGIYDISLIKVQHNIKGFIITIKSVEEVMNTVNEMMLDHVNTDFDHIVGNSEVILQAKALAKKVASSASTVLILGESGTGKELFARAIHHSSPRGQMPFVAINCAAIPDHLLESELFGYDEGAFTGAKRGGKPGKFQLANKGTLFLDEIGDMPLHLQAKLLRVLQEKRIDRLGSNTPVELDVRVIAATHRDLESKVLEGTFRQDLYYRLNVIPVIVPTLRERKDDLVLTAEYMVKKWSEKLQKQTPVMSDDFIKSLLGHNWPGNVRELENAIEYAVNVCDEKILERYHLPKRILSALDNNEIKISALDALGVLGALQQDLNHDKRQASLDYVIKSISDLENEAILAAVAQFGDSGEGLAKVASVLGLSRATLYRKLKVLKITHETEQM